MLQVARVQARGAKNTPGSATKTYLHGLWSLQSAQPPRQWCSWTNATFCFGPRATIPHSGWVRPPGRLPTSGRKCLKTAKRRYEEENLTWGDNPKVAIVLLGESRNRPQCSSRSEMMSLAEHNILFALSRRRVTIRARCVSQRLASAQGKVHEGREEAAGRGKSCPVRKSNSDICDPWCVAGPFPALLSLRNGVLD